MRNLLLQHVLAGTIYTSCLIGQSPTLLQASRTDRIPEDLAQRVHLLGFTDAGEEFIVMVPDGPQSAWGAGLRGRVLLRGPNGWKLVAEVPSLQSHPVGFVGKWFVFSKWNGFKAEIWSLNVTSGVTSRIETGIVPLAIASGNGARLAILGSKENGALTVDLWDKDLKQTGSFELTGLDQSQVPKPYLSFATETRLLLVDGSAMSYLPLNLDSGKVKIGEAVYLTGSEIELSRSWPRPASPFRQPTGRSAPVLVLAHVPLANDENMFFLGPYRDQEGYRVGIFDGSGRQASAFRLAVSQAGSPGAGAFVRHAVRLVGGQNVVVLTVRGVRQEFGLGRP